MPSNPVPTVIVEKDGMRPMQVSEDQLERFEAAGWKKQAELPAPDANADEGEGENEAVSYNDMTVAQLRAEIENRDLEVDRRASKVTLVSTLEADDAANEE